MISYLFLLPVLMGGEGKCDFKSFDEAQLDSDNFYGEIDFTLDDQYSFGFWIMNAPMRKNYYLSYSKPYFQELQETDGLHLFNFQIDANIQTLVFQESAYRVEETGQKIYIIFMMQTKNGLTMFEFPLDYSQFDGKWVFLYCTYSNKLVFEFVVFNTGDGSFMNVLLNIPFLKESSNAKLQFGGRGQFQIGEASTNLDILSGRISIPIIFNLANIFYDWQQSDFVSFLQSQNCFMPACPVQQQVTILDTVFSASNLTKFQYSADFRGEIQSMEFWMKRGQILELSMVEFLFAFGTNLKGIDYNLIRISGVPFDDQFLFATQFDGFYYDPSMQKTAYVFLILPISTITSWCYFRYSFIRTEDSDIVVVQIVSADGPTIIARVFQELYFRHYTNFKGYLTLFSEKNGLEPGYFIPFQGQIANFQITNCVSHVGQISLDSDLNCHKLCQKCLGPNQWDCLTCHPEQNRILLQERSTCICIKNYQEINGQLICKQKIQQISQISKNRQSYRIQCNYGYYSIYNNDELICMQCPYLFQQSTQCLNCLLNSESWASNPICDQGYETLNGKYYSLILRQDYELFKINQNFKTAEICQGCQTLNSCQKNRFYQNGNCIQCSRNCANCENQFCVECEIGYYLNNGECLQCPSNCKDCEKNEMKVKCITCIDSNAIVGEQCQQCGNNCKQCEYRKFNDSYYLKCLWCQPDAFISLDGVSCYYNTLAYCITPFQFSNQNLEINTIFYDFEPQHIESISTGCTICYGYAFLVLDNNIFQCFSHKEGYINPLCYFVTLFNEQKLCVLGSAYENQQYGYCYHEYPQCQFCFDLKNSITKYCLYCSKGYYNDYYTSFCIPCPKQCLNCYQSDSSKIKKFIQLVSINQILNFSYFQFIELTQDTNPQNVQIFCTECSEGYNLYDNQCRINCPSNCQECKYVNNLPYCLSCLDLDEYSHITLENGQCISCPTNCKLCKTRTAEEQATINPYFSNLNFALFSSECVVPTDISLLFYDQKLKQFINCQKCEKYVDIVINVDCNSNIENDKFNIKLDKLFNNNILNYLSDIETSEYYLYLNTEFVKQVNYKFNLEHNSICILNINTYFSSTLLQNVFNLLEINFLLEGNNSTLIINSNITLKNFSSITIQNLNIKNGALITHNIKGYLIQLENITVSGSTDGASLTDQKQSSFQFNHAASITIKNIDIIKMKFTKQSSLILINSLNLIVTLDCQNIYFKMSEFQETQIFFMIVAQSILTLKNISIINTLFISSQFILGLSNSRSELIKITIINSQIIDSINFFLIKNITLFDQLNISTSTLKNSNFIQANQGLDVINSTFFNLKIQGYSTLLKFTSFIEDCKIVILQTNFIDIQYQQQQPIMLVQQASNYYISVIFNQVNLINIFLEQILMQQNYQASIKMSIFYLDCSEVLFNNVNFIKGLGFPEFSILNVFNFTFINSNISLDNQYQFKSIHASSNCINMQNNTSYFRTFIFLNNVLEMHLNNVTFKNLIVYDSAFLDYKQTIQLNNSVVQMIGCQFLSNIIHQTQTDSRVSLFKIVSFVELSVLFDNNQFNKNLLQITISESSTREGLLFTIISSNCTLSNSIFSYNMIINGQSSIFQIDSNELLIESNVFKSNSIFVYETIKQFLVWGFEGVVYQEDLEQLFPAKSQGGNGNLKASKISIMNSLIEKSHSKFGGAFAITLLENGFLIVQNSSFQNLSLDMSDNSQGGCLFVSSNSQILRIEIIKSTFKFIEARESGGLLFLQTSTMLPQLTFILSTFSNIFALQGSLVYIQQTYQGNPSFLLKECIIENNEQILQAFLNNIQQITNLELTILTQFFSLVYFTDGLIEIQNLTIQEYPLLQFLHTQNSVHLTDVKFIDIVFTRPLLTFNTNANTMIIQIDTLSFINCTMAEQLTINLVQASQRKNIKNYCVNYEAPPSIVLAGYSSGSLNYQTLVQMLIGQVIQGVISFNSFKDSDIINIRSLQIQVSCKNCQFGVLGFLNQQQTNTKITGLIISNSKCGNLGCLHINSQNKRLLSEKNLAMRNSIQIRNLICTHNEAEFGGCLYLKNQQISIYESQMVKNSATLGGAIYIEGATSILDANQLYIFSNNAKKGSGVYSFDNYLSQQNGISFIDNFGQTLSTKPSQLKIQFFPDQIITPIITFKDQYHVQSKLIYENRLETTIYLPTGIEIQKYRRFSMKHNQYSNQIQILRLYSLTQTFEATDLTGTYCNVWVIDENNVKYQNLTNTNIFYYDKEFYDLGDLILYIPQDQNKQFWLQFWCNSLFSPVMMDGKIISFHQNYTLQVKIKPYECQLGEYHFGNQDYCHQCQTDLRQYSVTYNSTECQTQNDLMINDFTSAQVKLKKGYWRYQITSSIIDNCYNREENCVGGWDVENNLCLEGYIGALCEQCDTYDIRGHGSFYQSQQFECQPCKNTYFTNEVHVISSTIILIILLCFFSQLQQKGQLMALSLSLTKVQQVQLKESISLQYIKLIVQYFQIVSLLGELYLLYDTGLQMFIHILGNPFQMNFLNFCSLIGSQFEIVYFDILSNTSILFAIFSILLIILIIFHCLGLIKMRKQKILDYLFLIYIFYGSSIVRCVLKLISFRKIQDQMWIYQNVSYIYDTFIHLKLVFGVFLPFLLFFCVLLTIYLLLKERKMNQGKILKFGIWYQAFKNCLQESFKLISLILIHICIIFVDGDFTLRCLMAFFVLIVYHQIIYYKLPYWSNLQNIFEMRLILFSLSSMVLSIFHRVVNGTFISEIIRIISYCLIYLSFLLIIQGLIKSQIIPAEKLLTLFIRQLIKWYPFLSNRFFFYKYSHQAEKEKTRRLALLRNYLLTVSKKTLQSQVSLFESH